MRGAGAGPSGRIGDMASPHNTPGAPTPRQSYAERAFRSPAGIATGVTLLALGLWLGGDAVIRGGGRTPWLSLAGMLLAFPLVLAFTLRPAVFAGDDRLRVRNPFRMITVPWAAVEDIRSGYSNELFAGGRKYQLWAIPVSLRARKRAVRQTARAVAAGDPYVTGAQSAASAGPTRAWSDRTIDELRELAAQNAAREAAQGQVTIRWAYEVIVPAVAGAVVLAILLAIG